MFLSDQQTLNGKPEFLALNSDEVVIQTLDYWTPLARSSCQRRGSIKNCGELQSIQRSHDRCSKCSPDRSPESAIKHSLPCGPESDHIPNHLSRRNSKENQNVETSDSDGAVLDEELELKLREVALFLADVRANPADDQRFLCTALSLAPQLVVLAILQRELIGSLEIFINFFW